MATREELIASAPEYIWADQVMGIWLGKDQSDRRSPLVKYRRADAALPQGEDAGGVVAKIDQWDRCYPGNLNIERMVDDCRAAIEAQSAQIASLSAKVAEVERERDDARAEVESLRTGMLRNVGRMRDKATAAESHASELQREVERLRSLIQNMNRHYNPGSGDFDIDAALQQEGESNE